MIRRAAVSAAILVFASSISADVIFNNFGPNNAHLGNTGWSVANGGPFGVHLEQAASFTPAASYFLNTVEIAIGHLFGPNRLDIRIHGDTGGTGSPGQVLEVVTIIDQVLTFPNEPHINNPPVVVNFSGNLQLMQGARYWLSISSDNTTDSWFAWNYNTIEDRGQRAHRENGGAWSMFTGDPRGTFRINGTPIPAPGALALVAALGVIGCRRRRDQSQREA